VAYIVPYIDAAGIHTPTYPDILAKRQADFRAIFGADLYLEADSQEGQMLAMFAQAEHDANQLAVAVYNAFSPQTAQGAGLSRMVKINGLTRLTASHSTAEVHLVGTVGTSITAGVVADVAGRKWDLPASVTIPSGGSITVTATAQDEGDIQAAAGEIATIATPTRGWLSVTNAAAATPGAAVESDAVLRKRQGVSTALPSKTVLEGIAGAVANLSGVTRCQPYENDTDAVDANGLPAHSITLVVEGGDDAAIAEAIRLKKAPGVRTNGTTAVAVADEYGVPGTMRFYRAAPVAPYILVGLKALAGYVSTTGVAIQANLAAYQNALGIGEDVLLSKLYTPINAAEPVAAKKTFEVLSLAIGRTEATAAAANLALAFNEVAVGAVNNVILTVS
jgi:uncharacterized phage protein gp47/JayE